MEKRLKSSFVSCALSSRAPRVSQQPYLLKSSSLRASIRSSNSALRQSYCAARLTNHCASSIRSSHVWGGTSKAGGVGEGAVMVAMLPTLRGGIAGGDCFPFCPTCCLPTALLVCVEAEGEGQFGGIESPANLVMFFC